MSYRYFCLMALSIQKRLSKYTQKKIARKEKQKREKQLEWLNPVLFVAGFIAFLYVIMHSKHTFISPVTLCLIGLVPGIVLSLLMMKMFKKHGLYTVLLMGSLALAVFFGINETFSNDSAIIKRRITNRSISHGKGSSWVEIRYEGNTERLSVSRDGIEEAAFVVLNIREGFWGYAYVDEYQLVSN